MGRAGPVSRKGTDVSAPDPQSISALWVVRTAAKNKDAEKLYQDLGPGGLSAPIGVWPPFAASAQCSSKRASPWFSFPGSA